jgi:hypothetical protein
MSFETAIEHKHFEWFRTGISLDNGQCDITNLDPLYSSHHCFFRSYLDLQSSRVHMWIQTLLRLLGSLICKHGLTVAWVHFIPPAYWHSCRWVAHFHCYTKPLKIAEFIFKFSSTLLERSAILLQTVNSDKTILEMLESVRKSNIRNFL